MAGPNCHVCSMLYMAVHRTTDVYNIWSLIYIYIHITSIYPFVVMPAHIKERVSWGAAKRELLAHMCKWDMAFPRVTQVIDMGVTSDQQRVWKAERLSDDQSAQRAIESHTENTCPWETESGTTFEAESVGESSCTTEALPNTSPPKKRRVR